MWEMAVVFEFLTVFKSYLRLNHLYPVADLEQALVESPGPGMAPAVAAIAVAGVTAVAAIAVAGLTAVAAIAVAVAGLKAVAAKAVAGLTAAATASGTTATAASDRERRPGTPRRIHAAEIAAPDRTPYKVPDSSLSLYAQQQLRSRDPN
jgi:hypothetical protein